MSRHSWPNREGFSMVTEYFCVTTEFAKARRNYVSTEEFYVAVELAKVGRVSIATEDFSIATEMVTTKVLCYPQHS